MKKLIWANFKMNKTPHEVQQYLDEFLNLYQSSNWLDVVFFPQMACLPSALGLISKPGLFLWSQTMHQLDSGAFTWETSPLVLKELGCKYVLLGHSERRTYFHETDILLNAKIVSAINNGIRPILCVGETLEQKEQGIATKIVEKQLSTCLANVDMTQVDIAYEPVWSIGTGKIPTSEEIFDMHKLIRTILKNNESRILYGGSSNDQNAAELIGIKDVDWFLVGWASLDPTKFINMINAINN